MSFLSITVTYMRIEIIVLLFVVAVVSAMSPFPSDYAAKSQSWLCETAEANSVATAMNEAWMLPNVEDVIVNVPLELFNSNYRPFGDGQSNAKCTFKEFESAHSADVPITVSLVFDSRRDIVGIFVALSCQFGQSGAFVEIAVVNGTRLSANTFVVRKPLCALTAAFVGGASWSTAQINGASCEFGNATNRHSFALSTVFTVAANESVFLQTVPKGQSHFTNGMNLFDPLGVSDNCGNVDAFDCLLSQTPLSTNVIANNGYAYYADSLHGRYPDANGIVTSLANLTTWVFTHSPFNMVYSCWSPRDRTLEDKYGAPSGAGWHRIGDAGESVVSNVGSGSMLVAMAMPPNAANRTTAVWRVLREDEVWVTTQQLFHRYLIASDTIAPCTQILMHDCVPPIGSPTFC